MDDGDDDDDDNDDDDILMVTKLTSQGRQLLIYRKLSMLWIVKKRLLPSWYCISLNVYKHTEFDVMIISVKNQCNVYTTLSLRMFTMLFYVNQTHQ